MELSNEFVVPTGIDDAWKVLTDVERIAPCLPGAELTEIEGDEYRGVVKVKVGPITAQYKGKATFVERDDEKYVAVLRAEGRDTRGQGNANATITATLVAEGDGTRVSVVTDLTVTGKVAQFGRGIMADVSAKLMGQFATCLQTKVLAGEPEPTVVDLTDVPVPAETSPAEASPADPGPAGAGAAGASNAGGAGDAGASGARDAGPAAEPATSPETLPVSEQMPGGTGNGLASAGPRRVSYAPAAPVDLLDTAGAPLLKRLAPAVLGAVALLLVVGRLRRRRR